MADEQLAPVRTPVSATDLYSALRREWRMLLRSEPSRASLVVLLAQWDFETGGGKACVCWNLAGLKYSPGCGQDYACYSTHERTAAGVLVTIHPPDPGCRFRAYATLDDGALDYLRLLRTRFERAWPAVEAGDLAGFAHELKVAGYYTDREDLYRAGLEARAAEIQRAIGPDTSPDLMAGIKPLFVAPNDDEPDPPSEPPASA